MILDKHETNDFYIEDDWLEYNFIPARGKLADEMDKENLFWNSANLKFTTPRYGESLELNPIPRFNVLTDPPVGKSLLSDREETTVVPGIKINQGHYYSQTLDDNKQLAYITLGVAERNGIFDYLTRAIDQRTARLSRTGKASTLGDIAYAAGAALTFLTLPVLSLIVYGVKFAVSYFSDNKALSYYYLKPTMHTFWSATNNLATAIATEIGILPTVLDKGDPKVVGTKASLDEDDYKRIKQYAPFLLTDANGIDVLGIVLQPHINRVKLLQQSFLDGAKYGTGVRIKYTKNGKGFKHYIDSVIQGSKELWVDDDEVKDKDSSKSAKVSDEASKAAVDDYRKKTINEDGSVNINPDDKSDITKYVEATYNGGAESLVLRVEYVGPGTFTWSNSVTDIPTGGVINSLSRGVNTLKFSGAGGLAASLGLDDVASTIKDTLISGANGLTFGLGNVLTSILDGVFLDVPKMWDDSTFSLPTHTYIIPLRSVYGNQISQMMDLYVPMAAIITAGVPLSGGGESYVSPYLCNWFVKGIAASELSMITNISISIANGNLAYDSNMRPLGYDVAVTVTDLSNIATAIGSRDIAGSNFIYDNNNPMGRFVGVITGRDKYSSSYASAKLSIKLSNLIKNADEMISPAFAGMRVGSIKKSVLGVFAAKTNTEFNQLNK